MRGSRAKIGFEGNIMVNIKGSEKWEICWEVEAGFRRDIF